MSLLNKLFNISRVETWPDGTKEWCRYGLRHREEGPAIEHPDGMKEWWQNGKLIAKVPAEAAAVED